MSNNDSMERRIVALQSGTVCGTAVVIGKDPFTGKVSFVTTRSNITEDRMFLKRDHAKGAPTYGYATPESVYDVVGVPELVLFKAYVTSKAFDTLVPIEMAEDVRSCGNCIVAGYPVSDLTPDGVFSLEQYGGLEQVHGTLFLDVHNADTRYGMDGSAVLSTNSDGNWVLYGVHAEGDSSLHSCYRLLGTQPIKKSNELPRRGV